MGEIHAKTEKVILECFMSHQRDCFFFPYRFSHCIFFFSSAYLYFFVTGMVELLLRESSVFNLLFVEYPAISVDMTLLCHFFFFSLA